MSDGAASSAAGVRKPPREETALEERAAVPRALWGFEWRGRSDGLESSGCNELFGG
jgi:hypothetical protein